MITDVIKELEGRHERDKSLIVPGALETSKGEKHKKAKTGGKSRKQEKRGPWHLHDPVLSYPTPSTLANRPAGLEPFREPLERLFSVRG